MKLADESRERESAKEEGPRLAERVEEEETDVVDALEK
jgi:hypothetical protein